MAVLMENRDDFNILVTGQEIHGIGKSVEQGAANPVVDRWKLKRSGGDPLENVIELVQELKPKTKSPVLIPTRSLLDVKLCLKPGGELAHQRADPPPSFDRISSRTSSHGLATSGFPSWAASRLSNTCLCHSGTAT